MKVFEAGSPVKVNAIAHWTFEDCWAYIHRHNILYHPLHDQGMACGRAQLRWQP